jgi:hypothetical protein
MTLQKEALPPQEQKDSLLSLENLRRSLLQIREEEWRQKSWALWLHSGDENTKFFQAYAKGRKMTNTIWGIKDQSGRLQTSFEDMERLGSSHFKSQYSADSRVSIDVVIQMALLFPRFVEEEENEELMVEVS